jgi:hypothetical protein
MMAMGLAELLIIMSCPVTAAVIAFGIYHWLARKEPKGPPAAPAPAPTTSTSASASASTTDGSGSKSGNSSGDVGPAR